MNGLKFEWDPKKAARNVRKHGISFEEAQTVFEDPNHWLDFDREHSDEEERSLIIGLSSRMRFLSVVYTEHDETIQLIRIISARRANSTETRRYTGEA